MILRNMALIWGYLLLFILKLNNVEGSAVMSVDLGSEWMKVGVVAPDVKMEIALNKESKRKTPSAIAFRNNIRSFGEDVQSVGVRFPNASFLYIIDLLGKTIDNPLVEFYRKRFPHYELQEGKDQNTVNFKSEEGSFSVEELVAQLLLHAKEIAESKAGQSIKECVLVVPGYFGQAERHAIITAAKLADLQVLQLINDYTAVALNYGVFRQREFNETAQYYIFYDMGAQKTSAVLVSYQLVKDKITKETNPVIQILGVGYDRTLGGLEIQLRLRDYLGQEFNKLKKVKENVLKNHRAAAKLFKEAGRLKTVLSANQEHFAQIENLINDHDFKLKVTREQLETVCSDLWPRLTKPVEQALKSSGLSLDIVNQFVLFGGGTRVPKVQKILYDFFKQKDLSKNLNADEAAAMGAVYKAADLSTGFKVKKFIIKDAVIFPIQVLFERETSEGNIKQVKRTLFGLMNSYPQKKVITFNKYYNDFSFYVNYGDINHLIPEEISYIGNLNISRIELKKINEIIEKHKGSNVDYKGIKTHFTIDDSGIFSLTGVDFLVEKETDEDDKENTFSKISSTISKLFSREKVDEDMNAKTQNESERFNYTTEEELKNLNETEVKLNKTDFNETESSVKNKTIRTVVIKEPVEYKLTEIHVKSLEPEVFEKSYKKLEEINKLEKERKRRELALNALESHVIEARDRLNNEEYSVCASDAEKNKILDICSEISHWLEEEGEDSDAETFEKRLQELKKLTYEVYARHWEHQERPHAIKNLENVIKIAEEFLKNAKTLTKESNPEKDIFTEVELKTLQNIIEETNTWKDTEIEEQNKLKPHENVKLTVEKISSRMHSVDREVKYLMNKLKIWRPKKPLKKDKNVTEEIPASSEDVNKTEIPEEQKDPIFTEPIDAKPIDEPESLDNVTESSQTPSSHQEL